MKQLNARFLPGRPPNCDQYREQSAEGFECYAKHYSTTLFHPVGSVRMGKISDPKTVLDSKFRLNRSLKIKTFNL